MRESALQRTTVVAVTAITEGTPGMCACAEAVLVFCGMITAVKALAHNSEQLPSVGKTVRDVVAANWPSSPDRCTRMP